MVNVLVYINKDADINISSLFEYILNSNACEIKFHDKKEFSASVTVYMCIHSDDFCFFFQDFRH